MKLGAFIEQLIELRDEQDGNDELEVYYRHGASGDCGPLASAQVTREVDHETGPFDLPPGKEYVSIYAGN